MANSKIKSSTRTAERMVTFEITTLRPLPVGQQIFISGNIDTLGNWQPDGFPLTRLDDNVWSGYTVMRSGIPIEFKITRGSWSTEEAAADGTRRPDNLTIAEQGNASFKHTVARWVDRP